MQTIQTYNINYPGVSSTSTQEVVSEQIALLSDFKGGGLYAANASQSVIFNGGFYTNFQFQYSMTGSGTSSFAVSSSVDGVNWVPQSNTTLMTVSQSAYTMTGYKGIVRLDFSTTGSLSLANTASGSAYVLVGR